MNDIIQVLNEMRPYDDMELKPALARVLENEKFHGVLKYAFPDRDVQASIEVLKNVSSVSGFQEEFSSKAVASVLEQTATSFSYSGIENIDKNTSYLFISNHRDIVLDSAILQYVLLQNGHLTTQITFGSNLMSSQFIVDLGKINKMFTFFRGGSRLEVYKNALVHSQYIKDVIVNKNESIWIAQRDGRTKNGDDQTQLSLLKMLTIKEKDAIEAIKQLNIVPISISYEYEPCDLQKVSELQKAKHGTYNKSKDEDLNSILNGITGSKGKVHLAFGKPIKEYINENRSSLNACNIHQSVCDEMDRQIYSNYKLNAINYIAYDLLNNSVVYKGDQYCQTKVDDFKKMVENKVKTQADLDSEELTKAFFTMYASPLINALKVENSCFPI